MSPIAAPQLLAALNWRYATKKFDPSKKISAATWAALEQALVLAPSSFGLEPWKFVVVTDAALTRPLNAWLEAFLAVENAADARIETARGADGVVSVAGPRSWRGGIRARW